MKSSRPTVTTRGMPLGSESKMVRRPCGIARRHQLARRLVVAPQPRAVGAGQGLAVDLDLALVGDGEGRRLEHLAVDLDPAGGDPALGIAARAQAGARQPLGDPFGFAHLAGCRSQEGAEELRVALGDQELGMPLHADAEAVARRLDALDHAVGRGGVDHDAGRRIGRRLVVGAVHRQLVGADDAVQLRARARP